MLGTERCDVSWAAFPGGPRVELKEIHPNRIRCWAQTICLELKFISYPWRVRNKTFLVDSDSGSPCSCLLFLVESCSALQRPELMGTTDGRMPKQTPNGSPIATFVNFRMLHPIEVGGRGRPEAARTFWSLQTNDKIWLMIWQDQIRKNKGHFDMLWQLTGALQSSTEYCESPLSTCCCSCLSIMMSHNVTLNVWWATRELHTNHSKVAPSTWSLLWRAGSSVTIAGGSWRKTWPAGGNMSKPAVLSLLSEFEILWQCGDFRWFPIVDKKCKSRRLGASVIDFAVVSWPWNEMKWAKQIRMKCILCLSQNYRGHVGRM